MTFMSGASFIIGLGFGLCIGLILGVGSGLATGLSMEKKRLRKLIDDWVAGGEVRVQTRQGSPITAEQFQKMLSLPIR
jgi:hypothetical protein